MIASRHSNTDSTEKTVKMLLEHPKINVKSHSINNDEAIKMELKCLYDDAVKSIIKLLVE
jgi:hypothetical protein